MLFLPFSIHLVYRFLLLLLFVFASWYRATTQLPSWRTSSFESKFGSSPIHEKKNFASILPPSVKYALFFRMDSVRSCNSRTGGRPLPWWATQSIKSNSSVITGRGWEYRWWHKHTPLTLLTLFLIPINIVLGGTWASYPHAYQEEFIRDLFYAANTFYVRGNNTIIVHGR